MSTIVFSQGLYLAMKGHVDHCILSMAISGYEGACRPLFSLRGYIWLEGVDHCFLSMAISGYNGACRPLYSVNGYIWL